MDFSFDIGDALAGLIGAGSSAYGSLASISSNEEINERNIEANKELQKIAQDFNAEQAQITRDWTTELSNTAYQRQRADLEAAGYNPLLAINSGGASVPSSPTATSTASSVNLRPNDYSGFMDVGRDLGKIAKSFTGLDLAKKSADVSSAKSAAEISKTASEVAKMEGASKISKSELDKLRSDMEIEALEDIDTKVLDKHGKDINPTRSDYRNAIRNAIQREGYKNSRGHAIFEDVEPLATSALDALGFIKGRSSGFRKVSRSRKRSRNHR